MYKVGTVFDVIYKDDEGDETSEPFILVNTGHLVSVITGEVLDDPAPITRNRKTGAEGVEKEAVKAMGNQWYTVRFKTHSMRELINWEHYDHV